MNDTNTNTPSKGASGGSGKNKKQNIVPVLINEVLTAPEEGEGVTAGLSVPTRRRSMTLWRTSRAKQSSPLNLMCRGIAARHCSNLLVMEMEILACVRGSPGRR